MSSNSERDPRCQEIFARLSEYLDGELPNELRTAIETHICGCGPCVSFVESLKRSIKLSQEASALEIPSGLQAEVSQALHTAWKESMARRGSEA